MKLTKRFWLWVSAAVLSLILLIVSIVKGWNIVAIVAGIVLLISSLFVIDEVQAIRCRGMVQQDKHTILITWNPSDSGQVVK